MTANDRSATISLSGVYTKVPITVYSEDGKPRKTYTLVIEVEHETVTDTTTPAKTFTFNNETNGATAVKTGLTPAAVSNPVYNYVDSYTESAGKAISLTGDYGLKLCDTSDITGSYSIAFWMNPTTLGTGVDPVLAAGTFTPEYWLNITASVRGIWSNNGGYVNCGSVADSYFTIGEWQYVVLTVDEDTAGSAANTSAAKLYVNGSLVQEGDIAKGIMTKGGSLYFGVNGWDALFQGAVDDITVYNSVLGDKEIRSNAISGITVPTADAQPDPDSVDGTAVFSEADIIDTDVVDSIIPATPTQDTNNTVSPTPTPGTNNTVSPTPDTNNTVSPAPTQATDTSSSGASTVKKSVTKVVITKKGSSKAIKTATLKKGKKLKLAAKVTVKGGASKKVTWKSSKKKVATVSSKGVVTGKKKGTAKITATSKANKKKKCTIKVKVK
jgi:hypothetical protein